MGTRVTVPCVCLCAFMHICTCHGVRVQTRHPRTHTYAPLFVRTHTVRQRDKQDKQNRRTGTGQALPLNRWAARHGAMSASSAMSAALWHCTHSTGAWARVCMRVRMRVFVRVQTFIYTSTRCWRYAFRASFTSPWCSCSASGAPVAYRAGGRRGKQAHAHGEARARDLQELLSEFSVEACPCAAHEFDMLELILRGLVT